MNPVQFIREVATALLRGEIKRVSHESEGKALLLLEFPSLADALEAKDCLESLKAMLTSDRRAQSDEPEPTDE